MSTPEARFRLVIAGVGGQGVLSATRIVGEAARVAGLSVRIGQLHGMAQRGGMVEGAVVIGPGSTGHIGRGRADVVLGFELVETLRATRRMHSGTRVLLNRRAIPLAVLTQQGQDYPDPDTIVEELRAFAGRVDILDASKLAQELGDARTINAVMLGAAASLGLFPFSMADLRSAVESTSHSTARALNLRALELGAKAVLVSG